MIQPGRAGENRKANADDSIAASGGAVRGNAPIKNAARMPNNTPHVILMLSSCMAANLRRVSVPHFGIGTPHLEGQRAREIVNRFLMPQRGSGGADHSWQNAAKQNQDDDGGQDAHDDSSCRPSWQVTARHVDTSIRRARGKARWPPFSPVRLALILPGPWDSTSAKWRTGAAKRPRRKRLCAAPPRQILEDAEHLVAVWNER